jgi:peptide methionine sulfoxide reductase msrA/msrB
MEFLSGILLVIGGWFGFGATQVENVVTEPTVFVDEVIPVVEQGMAETIDTFTADDSTSAVSAEEIDPNATLPSELSDIKSPLPIQPNIQTALVAGGCFWCVEADLEKTAGVLSAVSGYAGGSTANPNYETYKTAGHREVVEVTYDASQVSFEDLLIVTLKTTDPTDDDGTFGDRGDGYSAAFYYETPEQKTIIENLIVEVDANGPYDVPLAIDIESRPTFWVAEDKHQDYYKGTLSRIPYQFYRNGSGRTAFIEKYWGDDTSPNLPWRLTILTNETTMNNTTYAWSNYSKPDIETLRATMEAVAFRVTQKDGTERAGSSPLDKVNDRGIFVDILSGEPLFSSRDKFDSGTGWPSFVAPITPEAVTAHEDRRLFSVRTETRSTIADNHLGHVFNDGPSDRGGLRYCMNGAAMQFVAEADMEDAGYGDFIDSL